MNKQETIIKLLQAGKVIRVLDGRCGNSFVDKQALKALIDQNKVTVFENNGLDFVKRKLIPFVDNPLTDRDM